MNTVKHRHKISIFSALMLVAVLISMTTSCDNSIERIEERETLYSIFGALDLYSETNYFRVNDLTVPLINDTLQNLNVTVTLTNIDRGISEVLTDSTVNFDSVITHNFRTTMNIMQDTNYRLHVEGNDGRMLTTTAATPFISDTTVDFRDPVNKCAQTITLDFKPVKPDSRLLVRVNFITTLNNAQPVSQDVSDQLRRFGKTVRYSFRPRKVISDQFELFGGSKDCSILLSDVFKISYTHTGPGFDEDIALTDSLSIPGGAGSFFGFYKDTVEIKIPNIDSLIAGGQ